ncbi:unnamed protein product [Dimorphilus gyrociliatus]|uniref:Cadherin domain-containing protein n=1 Tax=Dimorphilus gyrociliatus TaxID=2664684 RepID=A0A7I8WCL9_9ANNE|nr:unnamed protein product [Dimorphilus gyrociliatus]
MLPILAIILSIFLQNLVIANQGWIKLPKYKVKENQKAVVIANLAKDMNITLLENAKVTMHVEKEEIFKEVLYLEPSTGVLSTKHSIDREEYCPSQNDCFIEAFVTITSGGEYRTYVEVEIIDEDDNPPRFKEKKKNIVLSESESKGFKFNLPLAVDKDSDKYGIAYYSISNKTFVPFKLLESNDDILQASLTSELDRERVDHYDFVLIAHGKSPGRYEGRMNVHVSIDDVNEHAPRFVRTYQVEKEEDLVVGSEIVKVSATDKDVGDNGRVSYLLRDKSLKNFFAIDKDSGLLTTVAELDYERKHSFDITVLAVDNGEKRKTSETTVKLRIIDVNDEAPMINYVSGGSDKLFVKEEMKDVQTISLFRVQDSDSGDGGEFTCTVEEEDFDLTQSYKSDMFVIYSLETNRPFDREGEQQVVSATIKCKDKGQPQLTGEKKVDIHILDINDHGPKFKFDSFEFFVEENQDIGTFVGKIEATDGDDGENAVIVYSLVTDLQSDAVRIDETSGTISTAKKFDREQIDKYNFVVEARDKGKPAQTAEAKVRIIVKDIDDNPPVFTKQLYEFTLKEEQNSGDVGQVIAMDIDSYTNNQFEYRLDERTANLEIFTIAKYDGYIYSQQPLDREKGQIREIQVFAVSKDTPNVRTASTTVRVILDDINDCDPQFIYPTEMNNSISISNYYPVANVIAVVSAYDLDATDDNSRLQYSITSKTSYFKIDMDTGSVTVAKSLRSFSLRVFHLEITVQDYGIPTLFNRTILRVTVNASTPLPVHLRANADIMDSRNLIIIVIVASLSTVLSILLAAAIVITVRRKREERNPIIHKHQYPILFSTSKSPNHDDSDSNKSTSSITILKNGIINQNRNESLYSNGFATGSSIGLQVSENLILFH